jgi:hypothetical protein
MEVDQGAFLNFATTLVKSLPYTWQAKKAYDLIYMMVALKVCAKREAFDQYMWRMISMM